MNYKSKITRIGDMALEFLEGDFFIIFNNNAPEELAEISVLHTIEEVTEDIRAGNTVVISGKEYTVTAVGEEAIKTFRELGHCTFRFTGGSTVEQPGHVELKGNGKPDIKVGDYIEIK